MLIPILHQRVQHGNRVLQFSALIGFGKGKGVLEGVVGVGMRGAFGGKVGEEGGGWIGEGEFFVELAAD